MYVVLNTVRTEEYSELGKNLSNLTKRLNCIQSKLEVFYYLHQNTI